jgi:ABC-type phosphate/phosphonate transport system substrate-binding protein/PKD repeat protein
MTSSKVLFSLGLAVVFLLVFGTSSMASLESSINLEWNSFLGSTQPDASTSVAVDEWGNSYMTGSTAATWGDPIRPYSGGEDAYVAKLNTNGELLWNTFLGSTERDGGTKLVLDDLGNVYVCGDSRVWWGNPVTNHSGSDDAFVAKLDSNGNLLWNTFVGGTGGDISPEIAVDNSGNVLIVGSSYATWGTPINPHQGGREIYLVKLDINGQPIFNTYMGSTQIDYSGDLATDSIGNIFVIGSSRGSWGSPMRPFSGYQDAFVAKFNDAGHLVWNTFLGSGGWEAGRDISIASDGSIVVAGEGQGSWGAPIYGFSGSNDGFVARLDADGGLLQNTFIGSSGFETVFGLTLNNNGNIFVTGRGDVVWGSPLIPLAGGEDVIVAELSYDLELLWYLFLGSTGTDIGYAIEMDPFQNIYVSGWSNSSWGSPVEPYSGDMDILVVKINLNEPPIANAGEEYGADEGEEIVLDACESSDPDGEIALWEWDLDNDGEFNDATGVNTSIVYPDNGSYTVGLRVTDDNGATDTTTAQIDVFNAPPAVGEITATGEPIRSETQLIVSADFTDPGVLDTHTAIWDWGDGSQCSTDTDPECAVTEVSGSGIVAGSHTYTIPGVYTILLSVTDKDGGSGEAMFQFIVVYDPEQGFVTGGGQIIPGGSSSYFSDYLPNIDGESPAVFGFNVKYKKGTSTVPSGNLMFQYRQGDFKLQSSDFEWLTITNSVWAKFKGYATIDGMEGIFPFRVDARDADKLGGSQDDRFIIKIWAPDANVGQDDPIYKASGDVQGQIVIHDKEDPEPRDPIYMVLPYFATGTGFMEYTAAAHRLGELLEARIGVGVEVYVPPGEPSESVEQTLESFMDGEANLTLLSPLNYLMLNERAGAQAAVGHLRKGPNPELLPYYQGQIFVRAGSGLDELSDLVGLDFCFGTFDSVSSAIVPRLEFMKRGIDPDTDLNASYLGSHLHTVMGVYDGECYAGASFVDARNLVENWEGYEDVKDVVEVIFETIHIPNDNYIFGTSFPEEYRDATVNAFLDLASDPESEEFAVLDVFMPGFEGLVEGNHDNYLDLLALIDDAGKTVEELWNTYWE